MSNSEESAVDDATLAYLIAGEKAVYWARVLLASTVMKNCPDGLG